MNDRHPVRGLILTACVLFAAMGCSDATFTSEPPDGLSCTATVGGPLTLVVGARANSPKPGLPALVQGLVRETAKQSARLQVVRVDGAPTVAVDATFRTNGNNDDLRQRDLDNFITQIATVVADLKPKEPEADVLGALTVAAHATPEGGTIVLLDSGLTTAGQLSFLDGDMFGANPDEAVQYLQTQNLMPNFTARSVVLVGLGNTADPQEALDENLRSAVITLWQTIAEKAGASCVQHVDSAGQRTSIDTGGIPVSVVPLPAPPTFVDCGTTVLGDVGSVGFKPNEAVFRDEAAARETLQTLASEIRGGRQVVTLTGTTSSAGTSEPNRILLSQQRAEAVKEVLVSLGVDASRITTVGAGSHGPNHVNDIGPDGALLPGPAAQNRSVVVEIACPGS